jgi:hypothetical protein
MPATHRRVASTDSRLPPQILTTKKRASRSIAIGIAAKTKAYADHGWPIPTARPVQVGSAIGADPGSSKKPPPSAPRATGDLLVAVFLGCGYSRFVHETAPLTLLHPYWHLLGTSRGEGQHLERLGGLTLGRRRTPSARPTPPEPTSAQLCQRCGTPPQEDDGDDSLLAHRRHNLGSGSVIAERLEGAGVFPDSARLPHALTCCCSIVSWDARNEELTNPRREPVKDTADRPEEPGGQPPTQLEPCSHCGRDINVTTDVCPYCGATLSNRQG